MKMKALLLALALSAAVPASAGYNVEATTARDWPGVAGKIAILPAACPPDFDCAWLNEVVAEYFAEETSPLSVDAATVSQAMMDAGTDQLDDRTREQLAQGLGVQSFLLVVVGNSEVNTTGAVAAPVYGGGFMVRPTTVAQGSLEVRVVSADGKLLAKATGFGESGFRRGKGVVGKVFGEIFYRLFPEDPEE